MKKDTLCKHTQAFLDEAKAPSIASRETVTDALTNLVQLSRGLDAQSREWARALQLSERTQPDEDLKALYEEVYQTCQALQRQIGESESALRRVSLSEEQFHRIVDRMRARAKELGYEV